MSVRADTRPPADALTRSLVQLVAEQAAERPDAVAVEDGGQRLTYAQLDAAGAAIAADLRAAGVDDEEVVGVCLPRSWQTICSFLGALRAGAAYLPIDPEHPPERQRKLIELAGVRLVLTEAEHDSGLPAGIVRLDPVELAGRETIGAPPPFTPGGDRLAYVLFTSGSTGEPKGVEVTNRNLVHFVSCGSEVVARGDDVSLHVVPLGFDLSAQEIWGTLANGGRLVVAPRGRPDPAQLGEMIVDREVTVLTISTGLFHELVRASLPLLGGLRLISAGGDVLSPMAAAELREAHPSVRLLNSYGPTEATIAASSYEVAKPDGEPVPIGRALPGYVLEVRDPEGAPVTAGEVGELWIGGPGVARGYRRDPERTAAAFPAVPGIGRMYRTGDRVRFRADGELLFLGRLDDQVKISAQRVEPGEVEHALASHPDLRQAVVVAREDVPGHKRLVGYAVPRPGASPEPGECKAYLSTRLPSFMVPSSIELLDALPLSERGKVDRAALPAPERRGTERQATEEEPVSELMAEVLQLESVGPNEDFFELGGTSLLAIQLAGRLRERLGLAADIEAVFEAPTPIALAGGLAIEDGGRGALPPLRAQARKATAPVSAAQRRAWLFGRMRPDSIAYQFAVIFRFEGSFDPTALEGALSEMTRRHEILRTSFVEHDGEPVQVIHPERSPRLETLDLRETGRSTWPRLIRQRVRARVDPTDAPLMRSTLARLDERSWELLHVEHHMIHDGWSFTIFADELAELYSARVEARPCPLAPLPVQFQDYARWEAEVRGSDEVQRQLKRWAQRLDPEPPLLELPGAGPRPDQESFAGSSVRRRLDGALADRLRGLARENRATLFMVSLAAFLAQLQRYSGRDDIQIGSGLANRRDPNAERVIGMVVNTVVLRCNLDGDPSVAELLQRVRAAALDAYTNADAPFDAVVKTVGARRKPNRSPLIQALFSFHDAPRGAERWAGLEVKLVQVVPNGTAKADLNVVGLADEDGGMTFVWEHSELLSDADADRLAGHHLRLLEQFVARPDARLSELDLLSGAERLELERWSIGEGSYDREATIAGLVEAQARRDPGALAVVDGARRLTYGELVERARGVAAHLHGRGVERGDRVGVLLGRCLDSPVAQLGILLAGAAYLPLDPQHPAARIGRTIADAGASIVLTDAELRQRLPVGVAALEVSEAAAEAPAAAAAIGATDLAYVIYTSGSSGEPKGVEVTHRNVVRLVDDPGYAELGAGTAMLHAASPAFDAATLEIWGPLANGGSVVCLAEQPSPDAVAAAIERHGVTTLWLTAGLFHELVDRRPECLSTIRQLLSGGDVLSPDHVRRALAALPPDGRLTNGYGPTETTTFAATHELRPGDPVEGAIPIGQPIQGTVCRVLNREGNELPVGIEGELAIGGDGVARGYHGDPELSAARFRPDPDRPGARRYLSGDRVRRRPDGTLEFLGRSDRQLKLRGVRVEPAEVESALRAHPQLADAAVTPFERLPGDLALAAYVVPASGSAAPAPTVLRAHAAARLPAAMVPTAWISLPELPLTANGKLDRDRLPAPGEEHLAREQGDIRPPTAAERRVIKCFEEVLGVEPVGAEDDFFALGGHSLLAVTLFGELERIGGKRLPLSTIFEAPTPRALAALIGSEAPRARWDNLIALKPQGSRPPLFAVTAGDGNIVGFAPLARHMPAEQPFYALQPSGLDGHRPLDNGIEAMAARYLAALRRVQPHGPYLLAGRCNGATVAYEMAQQLRAAGEEVPLLAALDSSPPAPKPRELAPGVPYDTLMEGAWVRAREQGEEVPDLDAPGGYTRLVEWLRTPLAAGISRYLHEFWRWRDDLREAWPDPLGVDADNLVRFAWTHAREELVAAMLPPLPLGCRTPDGDPWDWAMAAVWEELSRKPADPLSPRGWRAFRARLAEPLASGRLNRYLLGAWNRADLKAAFPQPLGGDADALRAWAWLYGVNEGLAPQLLPAPPSPLPFRRRLELALLPARAAAVRNRARAARGFRRLSSEARLRAIGELERRLGRPLPGAGERTIQRALATARRASASYRADPWPGRVVLIVSSEFEDKSSYLGWQVRARGGVERHHLPCGHVEMLREPGAALLARCLEERIEEALGR
jgi:amino acid adenylation domain-containing protein